MLRHECDCAMTHGLKKGCVVIIYSIVDYYYSSCYGYFFNIRNNMPNLELQKFSHFYRQSCEFKRQRNFQAAAGQNGRLDAIAWLSYFTSSQRPSWLNGQSVANLVCAMRNYRFTIQRDGHDLASLCILIGAVANQFNAQDIANSLLALNQMGVRWDALPGGFDDKLWAAVDRNAETFNARGANSHLLGA